jgi:hypothetical protein
MNFNIFHALETTRAPRRRLLRVRRRRSLRRKSAEFGIHQTGTHTVCKSLTHLLHCVLMHDMYLLQLSAIYLYTSNTRNSFFTVRKRFIYMHVMYIICSSEAPVDLGCVHTHTLKCIMLAYKLYIQCLRVTCKSVCVNKSYVCRVPICFVFLLILSTVAPVSAHLIYLSPMRRLIYRHTEMRSGFFNTFIAYVRIVVYARAAFRYTFSPRYCFKLECTDRT